ncbi:MAG: hypothetical protein M1814_001039 [Vezdaea aestivalis]|nr:MAG: hypothetical protein M1814_001039 [Vezdaea aestivalis]
MLCARCRRPRHKRPKAKKRTGNTSRRKLRVGNESEHPSGQRRARFRRYSGKTKSLYNVLFDCPASSQTGYIYVFSRKSAAGYFKVGCTINPASAKSRWRQCGHTLQTGYTRQTDFYQNAERLVHALLKDARFSERCGKHRTKDDGFVCHREWFRTSLKPIKDAFEAVLEAIDKGLYGPETQQLSPRWRNYLEAQDNLHGNITVAQFRDWVDGFHKAPLIGRAIDTPRSRPTARTRPADSHTEVSDTRDDEESSNNGHEPWDEDEAKEEVFSDQYDDNNSDAHDEGFSNYAFSDDGSEDNSGYLDTY